MLNWKQKLWSAFGIGIAIFFVLLWIGLMTQDTTPFTVEEVVVGGYVIVIIVVLVIAAIWYGVKFWILVYERLATR